jgi:acyl-CoA dehydrogenase
MDFAFSQRAIEFQQRTEEFMRDSVYPAEETFAAQLAERPDEWDSPPVMEELKQEARKRGLWNLFLPHSEFGAGLSNLEYAPIAELSGRSPYLAPEAMNCAAPDTGNMELLAMFGTSSQQETWLRPLLDGVLLDDRAGGRQLRRDQHRHPDLPGR